MKILFFSQRFLLPMDTGGKIRTGKILEQLSNINEIALISNLELPKEAKKIRQVFNLCEFFIPVPWKEVKKYSLLFFIRLAFQMFSKYPVSALNDYSKQLKMALEIEWKQGEYDLVICDFVQSALMFNNIRGGPRILFQHNVESEIAKRHIGRAGNIFAKLFWWMQWKKMMAYEAEACGMFDTVIAVSEKDRGTFRELYNLNSLITIPTGVDIDYFHPDEETEIVENSVVFCGSMDWLPNEDAVLFFLKEILPDIKKEIQDVRFTIVGRNPSPSLKKIVQNYSEATLTGWVKDTRPYIAESSLVIVPIRIGGGTRMKIYEAMSMGKPVISTSIGAEGLPVKGGVHIIIEDDPIPFAREVVNLLKNGEKRERIGTSGRDLVVTNFSWQHVSNKFHDICNATIEQFEKKVKECG